MGRGVNAKVPSTTDSFGRPFLTAEWRYLTMLNYQVAPALLRPFMPQGTELDQWHGRTFVSMVGFLFLNTKVRGLPIPFHRNFEEINLRFYVRRKAADGWRRGVVFIKEIVPRAAIALIARKLYNENYQAMATDHQIQFADSDSGKLATVSYSWTLNRRRNVLSVGVSGGATPLVAGSEEEFITEHYWGYAKQRDGGTVEYRVDHPSWRVWQVAENYFDCDVRRLYGGEFVAALSGEPSSAFVAEGSAITVYQGRQVV